jgi:hypothetical protein
MAIIRIVALGVLAIVAAGIGTDRAFASTVKAHTPFVPTYVSPPNRQKIKVISGPHRCFTHDGHTHCVGGGPGWH